MHHVKSDGLIKTPLDERGLVDLNKLIDVVKLTVDTEYVWASSRNDTHHLQWYSALYTNDDTVVDRQAFRDLMSRKTIVPRTFHNWVHHITEPPPMPSDEVMQYAIDAERVAISLARTASHAIRLARSKLLDEATLNGRLNDALEYYNDCVNRARCIPSEFSLVNVDEIEANSVEEMLRCNRVMGRLALHRVAYRDREVNKS